MLPGGALPCRDLLGNPGLRGPLAPEWTGPPGFRRLEFLSLAGAAGLGGELPPTLSLPALATLSLEACNLSGTLPAGWGAPGGLPVIRALQLGNNRLRWAVGSGHSGLAAAQGSLREVSSRAA